MITDEQARAVVASMRNAWSWHTPAEVGTLLAWARQELSRREQPDDGPILDEPDENGVYWLECDDVPRDVYRDPSGVWRYYDSGAQECLPLVGRVAKVGPNPFTKGGA